MNIQPFKILFVKLDEMRIPFCLLRDEDPFDELIVDLDLLVSNTRFNDAIKLLRALGYYLKTTEKANPYKSVLVKYEGGRLYVVDLHREPVQNGYVYLSGEAVLNSRIPVDEYYLPCDYHLLAILIVHNIIGKRQIQDKHRASIKRLIHELKNVEAPEETEESIRTLLAKFLSGETKYFHDNDSIDILRQELIAALDKVRPEDARVRRRAKIHRYLSRYEMRPRAPFYVILGVDGSGKSTLNEMLLDKFDSLSGFKATSQYMGPWGHYHLPILRKTRISPRSIMTPGDYFAALKNDELSSTEIGFRDIFEVVTKGKQASLPSETVRQIKEKSKLYVSLRFLRGQLSAYWFYGALCVEMLYRYARVYRKRRRGTVVFGDRYMYDLITGSMHGYSQKFSRIRKFLISIYFKPTKTYLLRVDAETVLARKNDLDSETLDVFIRLYDQLAEEYDIEVLDGTQTTEVNVNQIIESRFEEITNQIRV